MQCAPTKEISVNKILLSLSLLLVLQQSAFAQTPSTDDVLKGSAVFETTPWGRYYKAGMSALAKRNYGEADEKLMRAIRESKKRGTQNEQLMLARLALGEVYLGTWQYTDAEWLFDKSLELAKKFKGAESEEAAQCLNGLAWIYTGQRKFAKAETLAKQSIAIRQKLADNSPQLARSIYTLGKCLDKQGFSDQAEPLYRRAITILQNNPDYQGLLLADVMQDCATLYQRQGNRDEAADLFAKSFAAKEEFVALDQSIYAKGGVTLNWSEGSPRCRQLNEPDRTVKYMSANGLRVATAIYDDGIRLNVMVSMSNNSDKPIAVGVGPVKLFNRKPKQEELFRLDPNVIADVIQDKAESKAAWNRLLGNMQRQRIITNYSGYTPGPYWGAWGIPYQQWTSVYDVPDYAAREAYYAKANAIEATGIATANTMRGTALKPQVLNPGQSKTGIVYFEHKPFDEAYLQVTVGNAIFEFPYTLDGKL